MKKDISKIDAQKQINDFFKKIKEKSPEEIKKIKRLAMSYNIKLGENKKMFCEKCFYPYTDPSIRIKNDFLRIVCGKCGHISKWKIK